VNIAANLPQISRPPTLSQPPIGQLSADQIVLFV
jgi:hypothetical protein